MKFHNNKVMYISEVTLNVRDLSIMREFYTNIMGMRVIDENENQVSLGVKDKVLLRLINLKEGLKSHNTSGLYHIAYLLPSRSDLGAFLRHLAENSIAIGAGDHHVSEALYFDDPEGNGIEVYADRDYNLWNWINDEVSMSTDPVDFNSLLDSAKHEWTGMPEQSVIGHVHLSVIDIDANHKFYVDTLGFELVSKFGEQAEFVSDAKYHHHIAFNTWNRVVTVNPESNNLGIASFLIHIESEKKRDKIVQRLKDNGYSVTIKDDKFITKDPSNTRIVLTIK